MELSILLRLIMAHLLGDFLLQPDSWVKAKQSQHWRAPALYYHVGTVTLLSFVFLWDGTKWYIPIIIMITHLGIDIWKSYRPNNFSFYVIDQLLHVTVILLLWAATCLGWNTISLDIIHYTGSSHFWILILAYYFVTGPLGITIGKATAKWQKDAGMDIGGLKRAGMWIGRFERVLVLTFILLNQYTALGFLMTAKSILRFGDKDAHEQKKTEYILVGTLISFASAAIVGIIVSYVISQK